MNFVPIKKGERLLFRVPRSGFRVGQGQGKFGVLQSRHIFMEAQNTADMNSPRIMPSMKGASLRNVSMPPKRSTRLLMHHAMKNGNQNTKIAQLASMA